MKADPVRVQQLFEERLRSMQGKHDRIFFWLLLSEWILAIVIAGVWSPYAWAGRERSIHFHVWLALGAGFVINTVPLLLIQTRPGWWGTRQCITVAQMLWSGVLIHLTGGRIETHFHVFGSLAFISIYRDWRLLPTATLVVAADHLIRGLLWPESVYGVVNPEWWRFLEHAAWVLFEDIVLFIACLESIRELRIVAVREAQHEESNHRIEAEVRQRTAELHNSVERFRTLIENTNALPWELDVPSGSLTYVAPQAEQHFGYSVEVLMRPGFYLATLHPDDRERVSEHVASLIGKDPVPVGENGGVHGEDEQIDFRVITKSGDVREMRTTMRGSSSQPTILRGVLVDLTRHHRIENELRDAQKLEAVGRLASGVAHEINTPVQFVSDSVHFVREAVKDLFALVEQLRAAPRTATNGPEPEPIAAAMDRAVEDADLEYLTENVPKALDRSVEGLTRVAELVRAMKDFAHPDRTEMTQIDLNRTIQSTLMVARNEYKYVAESEVVAGEIPLVTCHGGEIGQVLLNLIVNAAHAIGDRVDGTAERGVITLQTWREEEFVVISVGDTGRGVPQEIRHRIFEPFFTTKEIGRGTGQGLAIAYNIIVKKHRGALTFVTEPNQGTTFFIRLPIQQSAARVEAAAA